MAQQERDDSNVPTVGTRAASYRLSFRPPVETVGQQVLQT